MSTPLENMVSHFPQGPVNMYCVGSVIVAVHPSLGIFIGNMVKTEILRLKPEVMNITSWPLITIDGK